MSTSGCGGPPVWLTFSPGSSRPSCSLCQPLSWFPSPSFCWCKERSSSTTTTTNNVSLSPLPECSNKDGLGCVVFFTYFLHMVTSDNQSLWILKSPSQLHGQSSVSFTASMDLDDSLGWYGDWWRERSCGNWFKVVGSSGVDLLFVLGGLTDGR